MIDKREPYPGSVKANSANDDAIIELTDEVIPKPEEDSGVLELSDDLIVDAPKTDAADESSEVEDDILTLDEQDDFESPKDEVLFGLDDEDADDDSKMADNEIITSAIEESFGFDDDEDFTPTDEFNLKDPDDDVVIVDRAPHDQDEGLAAISGGADTQKEEDIFDLEKEIEIEYELDDDEDEIVPIDDERGEDYQDFVSMVFGESGKSKPADRSEEPTEYIDLGKGEPNDMLGFEVDQKEEDQIIAETDDDAEPQFDDGNGLPDLESITELEFEDDDDEDDVLSLDEETFENSDDIIARTVEQSLSAEQEAERIKPAEKFEFESDEGDDLLALDEDRREDEEIVALAEEETLKFAKGGDLLDLDAEDEIITLDGAPELDDEKNEDIIEITEFDHHFSEEGETLFEQAGLLKASHPEDEEDFLELIELEDDSPAQDENMTGFGEAAEKTEYAPVNRFFNEALEEDGIEEDLNKPSVFKTALAADDTETETADPFFTDVLNQESDFEDDLTQGEAENFGAESDLKAEASTPSSEDERFDFDFDPGAIAQQVDRLDTFLSEDSSAEPAAASFPADQADEALPITPGQIDAAIARVISEKFSGKIENIIYEVIEKAVSKEIEHLKGVLLGNTRPDEDQ